MHARACMLVLFCGDSSLGRRSVWWSLDIPSCLTRPCAQQQTSTSNRRALHRLLLRLVRPLRRGGQPGKEAAMIGCMVGVDISSVFLTANPAPVATGDSSGTRTHTLPHPQHLDFQPATFTYAVYSLLADFRMWFDTACDLAAMAQQSVASSGFLQALA